MTDKRRNSNKKTPVRKRGDLTRKPPSRPIGDRIIEVNDTTNSTGPKNPVKEKR